MQDLHLVGITTDRRGLILSTSGGARAGGFVIPVDDELLAAIEELVASADEATEESDQLDEALDPVGPTSAALPAPRGRIESKLPVREVQARLRAGESLGAVAKAAGVDEDWVERFALPVWAEQRRIVERALDSHLERPRAGRSLLNLRRAVSVSLAVKGVAMTVGSFDQAWTSRLIGQDRWVVEFTFTQRGRSRTVSWEFDAIEGALTTDDRIASQLGFVTEDTRVTSRTGEPRDGIVGDPKAAAADEPASSGRSTARTAKKTRKAPTRKKTPAARKSAAKKRSTTKKTAAKKKAAATKPVATRPAPKKSAGKKAPVAKKTVTKKKSGAKKSAARKKATTKKSASQGSPVTEARRDTPGPSGPPAPPTPASGRIGTTAPPAPRTPALPDRPDGPVRDDAAPPAPPVPPVPTVDATAPTTERPTRPPAPSIRPRPRPEVAERHEPLAPVRRDPGPVPVRRVRVAPQVQGSPAPSEPSAAPAPSRPAPEPAPSAPANPAARAAARAEPSVQFRSGAAAPARSDAPRPEQPAPRPPSDEAVGANGAARPRRTRRQRQLKAR